MIDPAVDESIARSACAMVEARAPVFVLGPLARRCLDLCVPLARRLGAAIVTTPDAKGLVDETIPEAVGNYSFGPSDRAPAIVEAADVIIGVGTSFFGFASGFGRVFATARLIDITDDAMAIPIGMADGIALVGDPRATLHELTRAIGPVSRERWFDRQPAPLATAEETGDSPDGIHPVAAVRAIEAALPSPSRLVCDITTLALPLLQSARLGPDRRMFLQVESSASLGSGLAMALGVRMSSRCPTVALVGEWGLLANEGELSTVSLRDVGQFVVVCCSNSGSAMIRAGVEAQHFLVPAELHTWRAPRFELVAAGHGLQACTVRRASDLQSTLTSALQAPHPVLIDAIIDPLAKVPAAQARFGELDKSREAR